jgi:hypothetical protein
LLRLTAGQQATFAVPAGSGPRHVDPVIDEPTAAAAVSDWSSLGVLRSSVGAQGVTPVPGALLPQPLPVPLAASATAVSVKAKNGTTDLDALLVRPLVARLVLSGSGSASTELVQSTSLRPQTTQVGSAGATVRSYDDQGRLVQSLTLDAPRSIVLRPGGFAVVTR